MKLLIGIIMVLTTLSYCGNSENYFFTELFKYEDIDKNQEIKSINILDEKNGYLLGVDYRNSIRYPLGLVLKTTDGGKTFEHMSLGEGTPTFFSRSTDLKTMYIILIRKGRKKNSDKSILLRSIDNGDTWSIVHSCTEKIIRNVFFYNENIGFITVQDLYETKILKTKNGGKSWETIQMPFVSNSIANYITTDGFLFGIYTNQNDCIWKLNIFSNEVEQISIDLPADYIIDSFLKFDPIYKLFYILCRQKEWSNNCLFKIYCINNKKIIDFDYPIGDFNIYGNYISIVSWERNNEFKSVYYYSTNAGAKWEKEIPKCRLLSQYAVYGEGCFWSIAEIGEDLMWPLMVRKQSNEQ